MGQLHPDLERVNLPATRANYFPVFSPYHPGSSLSAHVETKPRNRVYETPSGPFPPLKIFLLLQFFLEKNRIPSPSPLRPIIFRYANYFYHFREKNLAIIVIFGEIFQLETTRSTRSRFYETELAVASFTWSPGRVGAKFGPVWRNE